ncbi:MAG: DNA polymerase Y family protein [Halieaceae bacterium]|nr:DNA polymerase Y family protein [Halieaceae bacterium]
MSTWLCLRFDLLPLQCLNRSEDKPVVVLAGARVVRSNDCATALGIKEGMSSATVRALTDSGSTVLLERNTDTERRCLQQLCCWAYTITPTLYTYREDCLLLEIGGCLNLFKGLEALLEKVASGIRSRSYRVQYGLAATPKAAWLLSFAEGNTAVDFQRDLSRRLAPLPLTLLDEFSRTVDSLHRAGLYTLGDILSLPTSALGRRCGKDFTLFLQQVLGVREDLQIDYQPPEAYSDDYWFGYEVKANDELLPTMQLLLQALCQFLRNTQLQTQEIAWRLIGIDGKLCEIVVRSTSSHSTWESWYQLTRIHLDQIRLTAGVEGLTLSCHSLRAGQLESIDLFRPHSEREPLGSLLDRLRSRLGLQAIEKVGCRDEHLPELALHLDSDNPDHDHSKGLECAQRPFWLMPQPQTLKQHGRHLYWNGVLSLVYGPERIEDNWWLEPVSRDYYIAKCRSGQHYWVFRDRLAKHWFIHGVFA